MAYVADYLIASSDGNCAECGTTVVVDQLPLEMGVFNPLLAAGTYDEKLDIKAVDLPHSIRTLLAHP